MGEYLTSINKMNTCVDNIENQFVRVLVNHENDFMQAYRGHMMKVSNELKFLQQKVIEAAGKLSNDDTITNLQSSIKWF